jgi:hypothetical protein
MRTLLLIMTAAFAASVLSACGIEPERPDPNLLTPADSRPQKGPGLFTGEEGKWTIGID